jgi:uncharacterized SAM-binding protein YcdF (DUF218 family)
MSKKILKFVFKTMAVFLFIVIIQVAYYLVSYNRNNKQINKYDLVIVFPNEIERIKEGVRLAQKSSKKQFSVAGVTDEEYEKMIVSGLIPNDLKFINSGLSHTTIRDILCLKQILKGYEKIVVVTSRYHVPRVNLLLRLMLFNEYKKIIVYPVDDRFKTKFTFFYEMYNELKKMWGSIGELIIYYATGSVNEEYTKVRKISNFTKNILFLE